MPDRVIGIDLGTTNSCVALLRDGEVVVIPNRSGYKTTPSFIAVTDKGKRLVGQLAKRQAVTNAEDTAYAIKRFIGRPWDSPPVQEAIPILPYKIVEGPQKDVRVVLRGQTYSLPELSSFVLAEMKLVAEEFLSEPVTKAVVTVPAYFNDSQRQATKDAGRIAGLDVLRVLNEPTAAALAYGHGKSLSRTIAVFDLGGGTFDISILNVTGGTFEVMASAGDTLLGGEDFDRRIVEHLVAEFEKEHGIDLRQDRTALQRLKDAAERAKIELSSTTETVVGVPFVAQKDAEPLNIESTLTRQTLEELTADLVSLTTDTCIDALKDAELAPGDIEEVILVGGMTRMPLVQQAVTAFFGRPPSKGIHADEAVAVGAALHGAALVEGNADTMLLDVTAHSLGVMVAGGKFQPLITRNTSVPTSARKVFTTTWDDQTTVRILVVQGEDPDAQKNDMLGTFALTDLRKAPKGQVEIEVTFSINAEGIVHVSAKDRDTGREQSIEVTGQSSLSEDEIKRMAEDARRYAVSERVGGEDERRRQSVVKLVADTEELLPKAIKAMARTTIDWSAIGRVRQQVSDAKEALAKKDADALGEAEMSLSIMIEQLRAMIT